MNEDESYHTAVHEAGHVVIGRALNIEIISADLKRQVSKRGHSTLGGVEFDFKRIPGEDIANAVKRKMIFAFAGTWAVHHILEVDANSSGGIENETDDLLVAESAAKGGERLGLTKADTSRIWSQAWKEAEDMTLNSKGAIVKLADELENHRYLASEKIAQTLNTKGGSALFGRLLLGFVIGFLIIRCGFLGPVELED
jgi:hypothetical protein